MQERKMLEKPVNTRLCRVIQSYARYNKNTIRLPRQHMSNRLVNPEFREIMAVPFWNLPTFYQQPRAGATIQYTFLIIIYSINNLRSWKKEHYPLPFPRAFLY